MYLGLPWPLFLPLSRQAQSRVARGQSDEVWRRYVLTYLLPYK